LGRLKTSVERGLQRSGGKTDHDKSCVVTGTPKSNAKRAMCI
jgi:hypothetical protein